MRTETVKFDVGGRKYKVARSLLEAYPTTMLAMSTSILWHDNADEEVYIERNGDRFAYCLDYLRDKKVTLPLSIPREAVFDDLRYYGVCDIDESAIAYSSIIEESGDGNAIVLGYAFEMIKELEKNIQKKKLEARYHQEVVEDHEMALKAMKYLFCGHECLEWHHLTKEEKKSGIGAAFQRPVTESRKQLFSTFGLQLEEFNFAYAWVKVRRCETNK